jgi:putative hydrolase of the HAD superfamily
MSIKAVLFDLDNTLIDFMKMKKEACKSAIKAMIDAGLKMKKREGYEKLMECYFRVGLDSSIAFTKFLEEQVGKAGEKILQAGIKGYQKTKPDYLKPYPYVLETLEMLKSFGLKLGIVTDAPREKALQRLNAMNITKYFNIIITVDDTGVGKKDLLPLELAIKKLNLSSEEILFVGDSLRRDIEPAKKIGMKTLLIKRYQDLRKIKSIV